MRHKKGFLYLEIMMGILLFSCCILTIAHYVVTIKNTYHTALQKIEALSYVRNSIEEQKALKKSPAPHHHSHADEKYKIIHTSVIKKNRDHTIQWYSATISNNSGTLVALLYAAHNDLDMLPHEKQKQ